MIATNHACKSICEYLVNQPINLDLLDNKARSALYLAIEADNIAMAQILVNHGASVVADPSRLAKMLCTIGYENDVQKLRLLIQSDCNIEVADYDKRTVGHLAAAEGHLQVLELLASESHFNFELRDRWNNSCFDEIKSDEMRALIERLVQSRQQSSQPIN